MSFSAVAWMGVLIATALEPTCGDPASGLRFASEIQDRLRCERAVLRGTERDCAQRAAACSEQVTRVVESVYGADEEVVEPAALRCRNAVRKATQRFLSTRMKELVLLGRRRATRSAEFVEDVVAACSGLDQPLPISGPCRAIDPASGPAEVAYCLRGSLEEIAQETSGVSIEPNILFVLTDDQRWDTMDAMPLTTKDVFDRGIEFTESFTSTSLCCPDRATILTGLYAHNHGVETNRGALDFDHERDTIPRQLQENAGYKTALLGKYMVAAGKALGPKVPPGWDEWHVFTTDRDLYYAYGLNTNGKIQRAGRKPRAYSTDRLALRSRNLIQRWADEPWFVYYAPFAPHTVPVPAERHKGAFADLEPWRPPSYREDLEGKPRWVHQQRGLIQLAGGEPARTDVRRRLMLGTLLAVDEAVDAFSVQLEALGLTDNTVVVFTSDNGFAWLEHWLILKNYPYEESVRVPLAVRYPRLIHVPRKVDLLVQPIDFYATFAELAGIEGESSNGESLLPILAGHDVEWRDTILLEHFFGAGIKPSKGVRTSRWKLVQTDDKKGVTLELYDLEADPYELKNVAEDPAHAELIESLKVKMNELAAS